MAPPIAAAEQPSVATSQGALGPELFEALRRGFEGNRAHRLAQNAVTQVSAEDVALNRAIVTSTDHSFSTVLDDWAVTNQKQSGRCWIFAGLNLLRAGIMKKLNVKEFELSQAYTHFW